MKIIKYVLFAICTILLVGLFSFNTKAETEDQLLPTKLRITVLDQLGNPVEGATVTIYASEKSYRANTDSVASASSDAKGRVTFSNLKTISYFVDARKDDMNNNGEGVKIAPLLEGKLNKVNTVIE